MSLGAAVTDLAGTFGRRLDSGQEEGEEEGCEEEGGKEEESRQEVLDVLGPVRRAE